MALWPPFTAKSAFTSHHNPRRGGRQGLPAFRINILGFHHDQRVCPLVIHIDNAICTTHPASGRQWTRETNALLSVQYLPQTKITQFSQSHVCTSREHGCEGGEYLLWRIV